MIQRIQSFYLFLSAFCAVGGLLGPVGHFHRAGIPVAELGNLYLTLPGGVRDFEPWALLVLLLLSVLLPLVAIFLFKRRMLQARLTVLAGLMSIGYYVVAAVFVHTYKEALDALFTVNLMAAFPAVSLVLDYLAFRGIMQDELIIRSLDRLR